MTFKMMISLIISFAVSAFFGKRYIPWLRAQHAGQEIKSNGPVWHKSKTGTPTMGGVMFILGILISILTVGFESILNGNYVHLLIFLFALSFGMIGFLDDWEKLKHKENLGLTAGMKFSLQVVAALVFVYFMKKFSFSTTEVYLPFFNIYFTIPDWLYYVGSVFIIVGTVNSVNITDGVDGLATGTSLPVFLFFAAVTFFWGKSYEEAGIFASSVVGGLAGFLIYNFNPAKVFMGDTGSLFLGGALAALAFAYNIPLILISLGFVFIIETLSDIIQVGYFKISHGKRVFKMAPFHHHLEMGGWTGKKWNEKELFTLFTSVSFIFAVLSFIGILRK